MYGFYKDLPYSYKNKLFIYNLYILELYVTQGFMYYYIHSNITVLVMQFLPCLIINYISKVCIYVYTYKTSLHCRMVRLHSLLKSY